MKYLTILMCTMALVGCGTQYTQTYTPATKAYSPPVVWTLASATEDEILALKQQVTDALKDPESARFGEFWALEGSNGKRTVCGYVNAKNSFGGYGGNKMVTTLGDSVVIQGGQFLGDLLPRICTPRTVE
ncbi:hypothetical protein L3Q72_06145 [Vibrio sp. JC009]|uniref:hypothetical protein n=1 Tax=Vibrio sp. JC009 TaxID=2912314 RepID=UPI0023B0DB0B|nr:hypothetical protein [Vibrio sp. JC009]WED22972.1 hypothetical protein L3Q72_06145 [Vibrio sp. JC009]